MRDVQKRATYIDYGVKMQMVNGRLRITVPCNKRWRTSLAQFIFIIIWTVMFFGSNTASFAPPEQPPASFMWIDVIIVTFFFAVGIWFIIFLLWYLFGQYVLELSDTTVRTGRSLFNYDFLGTHDAKTMRRIRFTPALDTNGKRHGNSAGRVFKQGFYDLRLDYGIKQQQVLSMAIEEAQVRVIKGIIRDYYAHLDQNS